MSNKKIKDMPENQRPRERWVEHGPKALLDSELIALFLRNGNQNESVIEVAENLLREIGGIEELKHASIGKLTNIRGIGKAKAILLLAAFELVDRVNPKKKKKILTPTTISKPHHCFKLMKDRLEGLKQEHFYVISLDVKNQVLSIDEVFKGILDATLVHPREIFGFAVKHSAAGIICVHNHPSGNVTPSVHDIEMTKALVKASKMMQISLIDHIIIGKDDYTSLKTYGCI